MDPTIMLCIDKECLEFPAMIGLDGESLVTQPWLRCVTHAQEARDSARMGCITQVWVLSCSDMAAINVGAAIKHDKPYIKVVLITHACDGSRASRAACAHIDEVWDKQQFLMHYHNAKTQFTYPEASAPTQGGFSNTSMQNSMVGDTQAYICAQSQGIVISNVSASGGVGKSIIM